MLAGLLSAAGMILSIPATARGAEVTAGPMIGHVTDTSARLWMQLSTSAEITIEATDVLRGRSAGRLRVPVEGPWPFVLDTPIGGLEPNHNYRVSLTIDGKPAKYPGPEIAIRTAPTPGEPDNFSVAFGSGFDAKSSPDGAIFKTIQLLQPRAFVFLGNCGYLPPTEDQFPEMRRAAYRMMADTQRSVRINPGLEVLARATAMYGIWGNRDYGAPASNKDWVYKQESLIAFQRYWPSPFFGTPETPGLFCNFVIADAEFFLLDPRYYRDADQDAARQNMLGEGQVAWLKNALTQSQATFKVIAVPNAVLAPYQQPMMSWCNYPEGAAFIRWLLEKHISGVVFVSGAGSFGEISWRKPADENAEYPLMELTTSRLSSVRNELLTPESNAQRQQDNPQRMTDAVTDTNFAAVEFGGPRSQRFITLRLYDAKGTVRAEKRAFATQLR